jgi:hypothetical protein
MFTLLVFLFVFFEQTLAETADSDREVRAQIAQTLGAKQKNDDSQEYQ